MADYGAPPPPAAPAYGPGGGPPAGPVFADMGRRLAARLIDVVLIGLVYTIVAVGGLLGALTQVETNADGEVVDGAGALASVIAGLAVLSVIAVVYEVAMVALRGATVGKQLMGIKVVRQDDGSLPGWGPSLLRWLIPWVGSFFCGIGQVVVYLSPFFDNTKRYQGWHDKVARTFVIRSQV